MTHRMLLVAVIGCVLTPRVRAQQSDTTAHHDSTTHAMPHSAALRTLTLGAIADLLIDASPDGSTLDSQRRFELREVQMAMGAGIDRHVRGDIVVSLDDAQRLSVMEASLSTVGLPRGLRLKAGRFHLPIGQQNAMHRPELPTVDYPLVIRRFLGVQGGMGTGLGLRIAFDPLGFAQELELTALEQFPDAHGHDDSTHHPGLIARPASPANKTLQGLGYTARLRNTVSLGDRSHIQLSLSAATGKRAHPFGCDLHDGHPIPCPAARGETGVNARQSLIGADVTLRLLSSAQTQARLIVQSELMRLHNEQPPLPPGAPDSARYLGPTAEETGAYLFAQWRLNPRLFVGGRVDWLDTGDTSQRDAGAASVYVQLALTELARLTATYERVRPTVGTNLDRLLMQFVIALGAHPSHAP